MARTHATKNQVSYPWNDANATAIKAKLDEHDQALDILAPSGSGAAGEKSRTRFFAVRAVTTSNVASFASVSTTLDGLTLVAGDRILVAAQSTGSQNGIYVVGTVAGGNAPWTRATDFAAAAVIPGEILFAVDAGTAGANRIYKTTVAGSITVGTTAITFEQLVRHPSGTVDGVNVTLGATANTIGIPRVLHIITVADGSTVLTGQTLDATYGKLEITDVWVKKTTATGGSTDAVQLCTDSGGSTAVSSSLALNAIAAGGIVRTTSLANTTFAAGAVFYVKRTHTTDCSCIMYVSGYRTA